VDLHREQAGAGVPADPDQDLIAQAAPADPELAYLKRHYRSVFETALRTTLAALPPRDANVLRLHFLEGIPSGAVGALYHVSKRSVNRWIAEIRARVLEEARRQLGAQLNVPASQIDSVIGLVQSQLSLSMPDLGSEPDGNVKD